MGLSEIYYTVGQVAERLKVTRQSVSRWIKEGRLTGEKIGREVIILKSDVDKLRCPECGQMIRKPNCHIKS